MRNRKIVFVCYNDANQESPYSDHRCAVYDTFEKAYNDMVKSANYYLDHGAALIDQWYNDPYSLKHATAARIMLRWDNGFQMALNISPAAIN